MRAISQRTGCLLWKKRGCCMVVVITITCTNPLVSSLSLATDEYEDLPKQIVHHIMSVVVKPVWQNHRNWSFRQSFWANISTIPSIIFCFTVPKIGANQYADGKPSPQDQGITVSQGRYYYWVLLAVIILAFDPGPFQITCCMRHTHGML